MITNSTSEPMNEEIKLDNIVYSLNEKEKTAIIIKNYNSKKEIFIPRSIVCKSQEYNIIKISSHAFNQLTKYIEFASDSKLEIFDKEAFSHSRFETFTIPSTVREIKEKFLDDTINLKQIIVHPDNQFFKTISNGQILIGKTKVDQSDYDRLIYCVPTAKAVTIPNYIKYISAYAFYHCIELEQVEFENDSNLQTIGEFAFSETSIKTITLPSELRTLSKSSFNDCKSLSQVEFGQNSKLEEIGEFAFQSTPLKSITIPSRVKTLNAYFDTTLKDIKISPDNPHFKIYDDKFILGKTADDFNCLVQYISKEENVIIPNFIEHICPFSVACYWVKKVEFEENSKLKTIGKRAFVGTNFMTIKIPSSLTVIEEEAFSTTKLRSIEFEEDSQLQVIQDYAFSSSPIVSITITSQVKEICEGAFENVTMLKKIEVSPKNPYFKTINNGQILIGKTQNDINSSFDRLIVSVRNIHTVTVPNYIEHIDPFSFSRCKRLEKIEFEANSKLKTIGMSAFELSFLRSIQIPSEVTIIGEDAFKKAKGLQKVEFEKNSKLQIIEKNAFFNTSIQSIIIPSNVVKIGEYAFWECYSLEKVEFEGNPKFQTIEHSTFNYTNLLNFTIPSEVRLIESYAFSMDESPVHQQIIIPTNSKLQRIGYNGLTGSPIEHLVIPSELTRLDTNWCKSTRLLKTIFVSPNNQVFKSYNNNEFIIGKSNLNQSNYDCLYFCVRNIKTVIIPNFIELICSSAFDCCRNLKKIEFERNSKVQLIDEYAFNESAIESILIPSEVTQISSFAFRRCSCLEKVEFEMNSKLRFICNDAFVDSPIRSISIPSSVQEIGSNAFNYCEKLQIIEIPDIFSKFKYIDFNSFNKNIVFMIPQHLINYFKKNAFLFKK